MSLSPNDYPDEVELGLVYKPTAIERLDAYGYDDCGAPLEEEGDHDDPAQCGSQDDRAIGTVREGAGRA